MFIDRILFFSFLLAVLSAQAQEKSTPQKTELSDKSVKTDQDSEDSDDLQRVQELKALKDPGHSEIESPQAQIVEIPPQKKGDPRWGLSIFPGISFSSEVRGFSMLPSLSGGLELDFRALYWLAVTAHSQFDLIYFSQDTGADDSLDFTKLTHVLGFRFQQPGGGFFIGPSIGFSQTTYNHRPQGGLSHRDKKATDNILTYALSGGFLFEANSSRHFSMGPRIDLYFYRPRKIVYMPNHNSYLFSLDLRFAF